MFVRGDVIFSEEASGAFVFDIKSNRISVGFFVGCQHIQWFFMIGNRIELTLLRILDRFNLIKSFTFCSTASTSISPTIAIARKSVRYQSW